MSGFEVYGAQQTGGSNEETKAKFEAMNKYVVETVGLEKAKTLVGVVSAIVDLGSQPLPDAEYALEGEDVELTKDQLEAKYKEDMQSKGVYFANGYNGNKKVMELMKKVPRSPFQCVALAIDFPSKIVDKGQFFGEDKSNPAPLRVWYGGKYWDGENMVIQNLTPLKVTNLAEDGAKEKLWSLNPKSILHKMAVASELVEDTKAAFLPARIDELLGKAFLFSVQVCFEQGKGKNADKRYYKEKVTFTGALMDGQEVPVLEKTNLVMLKKENDEQAVKEIPSHIRNTIARSKEFEGSKLQATILRLSENSNSATDEDEKPSTETQTETKATGQTNW